MSHTQAAAQETPIPLLDRPTLRTARLDVVRAGLAPVLEQIADGALQRELDGELPREAVRRLAVEGYGALRVPQDHGGGGLTLPELTQLWIDLAAADANLPQALRGHFALVEDRLWQHRLGSDQRHWFARFVSGELAGNAWSEVGGTAIDTQRTVLSQQKDGGYRLDGRKYYTTGTIFADWVDVYCRRARPGQEDDFVIAIVDTRRSGVTVLDDWDGFGQRGTGSGTTVFEDVEVPAGHVMPFGDRFPYQTALYQLNLLASLVGTGRAALRDVVREVRARTRTYSHANAPRVRDDAQVLARVGEIAAAVHAAEAATIRVATALDEVSTLANDPVATAAATEVAEIESSAAQVVVTDLVLRATSDLFDALGASATSRAKALDRHWRSARTLASHNPRILKARVVGDHVVNGTVPPYAWAIGATTRGQEWQARPATPSAVPDGDVSGVTGHASI